MKCYNKKNEKNCMFKQFSNMSAESCSLDNLEMVNSEIECLQFTLSPHEFKMTTTEEEYEGTTYSDYEIEI